VSRSKQIKVFQEDRQQTKRVVRTTNARDGSGTTVIGIFATTSRLFHRVRDRKIGTVAATEEIFQ
jgi:hypothetical protein